MTYQGHVENGAVVLDGPVKLPEGARVEIALLPVSEGQPEDASTPTLYERLRPLFGIANDLPPDGSRNLDHYLYGADKT